MHATSSGEKAYPTLTTKGLQALPVDYLSKHCTSYHSWIAQCLCMHWVAIWNALQAWKEYFTPLQHNITFSMFNASVLGWYILLDTDKCLFSFYLCKQHDVTSEQQCCINAKLYSRHQVLHVAESWHALAYLVNELPALVCYYIWGSKTTIQRM